MVDELLRLENGTSTQGPGTTVSFEPPWIEQMRRGFLDNAWTWAGQPTPVPTQQFAGLDPYEMQARNLTSGLGGFQPYIQGGAGAYGQGLGALGQGVQAGYYGAQGYDPNMGKAFYNPYEDQVVQKSLDDVYKNFTQQDMQARSGAVGSGAYGGGRGRIMEQERFNQLGRGMADTAGQLRSGGYSAAQQQAQDAFQNQQQRMQQAGQLGVQGANMYGHLGSGIAGLGRTGQELLGNQITMMNTLGGQARGIADQRLASQYKTAQGLADEPMNRLGVLSKLLTSMFPTTTGTGITTRYGNVDDQEQLLKDLFKSLGWTS
tara:strand:+ start:150 stop:1103 length:954 start_codon:yes stop_codon:yes gene_type:complete